MDMNKVDLLELGLELVEKLELIARILLPLKLLLLFIWPSHSIRKLG